MKKSSRRLLYKLFTTCFVAFCAYTTYSHKLPPYIWVEHALLIAHTWSETGAGLLISTAFWPLSALYFLGKYMTTWSFARRNLRRRKKNLKRNKR